MAPDDVCVVTGNIRAGASVESGQYGLWRIIDSISTTRRGIAGVIADG